MFASLSRRIDQAAYRAQHLSIIVNSLLLERAIRAITRHPAPEAPAHLVQTARARLRALLQRDLENVDSGMYPRELLFQIPYSEYVRILPALLRDMPRVVRRIRSGNYKDLPTDVDLKRYPPYYRRTFHWQSDGYLSRRSAEFYDLSVEVLFRGTADVLRRQIIPPVTRFLRGRTPGDVRLLDIACGTGRTLKQMAIAHPDLRYHGVDLSPYYIQAARERLVEVRDLSLIAENAETLPYVDGYFDVATSVYLFHELPKNARRRVIAEAYRVLRPGGLMVLEDATQRGDDPLLIDALGAFPEQFHEPFFNCYLRDDLGEIATECGFTVESTEHFITSKVVVARKPAH